jgi:hypothetical protein
MFFSTFENWLTCNNKWGTNFWEVQKIFNHMFGTMQNENDWLMNLQDKVGLH